MSNQKYFLEDLEWLLKDELKVEKKSKQNKAGQRGKILFYNKGFISYTNEEAFQSIGFGQDDTTQNQEFSVFQNGYVIKKAGVSISKIKKNQDHKMIGWTDDQEREFLFSFQFLMKDKINYNPSLEKQKKDKEKKKKQPLKEVFWEFWVRQEIEIQILKNRIKEQQQNNIEKENLKRCDDLIQKIDSVDIDVYDSETLGKQLKEHKIEDKYFGYIYKQLKNQTFKNIVAADITARSYQTYLINQNDYEKNKLKKIQAILRNHYNKKRDIDPNIQIDQINKIEDNQYNFQGGKLVDSQLLNSLMYHLQFNIDLNVDSLLKEREDFFDCLDFGSIQDLNKRSQARNDEKKKITLQNFEKLVKDYMGSETSDALQFKPLKKYCLELFGQPKQNHYYAKLLVDCFKKTKNFKQLKKAIEIYQKVLSNQHRLYQEAKRLETYDDQLILFSSDQYEIKPINQNQEILNQIKIKDPEVIVDKDKKDLEQSALHIITFTNLSQYNNLQNRSRQDQNKNLYQEVNQLTYQQSQEPHNQEIYPNNNKIKEIIKSSQQSDSYLFQQAIVNAQNDKLQPALNCLNQIQNKDKRVYRKGFELEKQITDKKLDFYSQKLFQYYLINNYDDIIDLWILEQILEHTFVIYIEQKDISLKEKLQEQLIPQFRSSELKTNSKIVLKYLLMDCQKEQIQDLNLFYDNLIDNLTIKKQVNDKERIKQLDQFQLISEKYFKTLQNK